MEKCTHGAFWVHLILTCITKITKIYFVLTYEKLLCIQKLIHGQTCRLDRYKVLHTDFEICCGTY